MPKAQPILIVHDDGTISLSRSLSIGDILSLLDIARQNVMSIKIQSTEVNDELHPGTTETGISEVTG
jgi:hypothetical protein